MAANRVGRIRNRTGEAGTLPGPQKRTASGVIGGQMRNHMRDKAYWSFIAAQAAGTEDDEARRVLVSFARDADDETFRRRAQRHLEAAGPRRGPVLCTESLEIIVTVEETIRKASGRRRLRS